MSTPPPGWNPQQQSFPQQQPPPGFGQQQPPQGWNPQQQQQQQGFPPQQPPPGYPQQGPPQGPPPGYQQQPPKKTSKAPLIIALVVGLLVLGGLGTGGYLYYDAHRDGGKEPSGLKMAANCGRVSQQTLERLRATNPKLSNESEGFTGCSWEPTKGVDGSGYRRLGVRMQEFTKVDGSGGSPQKQAESNYNALRSVFTTASSGTEVTLEPLNGVGDQADIAVVMTGTSMAEVAVIIRRGTKTLAVNYFGWDAGMFDSTRPDVNEMKAAANSVAAEVLGKL
jgi:hypothetical protein